MAIKIKGRINRSTGQKQVPIGVLTRIGLFAYGKGIVWWYQDLDISGMTGPCSPGLRISALCAGILYFGTLTMLTYIRLIHSALRSAVNFVSRSVNGAHSGKKHAYKRPIPTTVTNFEKESGLRTEEHRRLRVAKAGAKSQ